MSSLVRTSLFTIKISFRSLGSSLENRQYQVAYPQSDILLETPTGTITKVVNNLSFKIVY